MAFTDFVADLQVPDVGLSGLDCALSSHLDKLVPGGLVLEFGVFSGASVKKIAAALPNHDVYGFDSFEGLPENWVRTDGIFKKGAFDLKSRLPSVPHNVKLVKGWFNDTLPRFLDEHAGEKVSFLHIDCDLYSSTKCVFDLLTERGALHDKVLIVFDELVNYSTYKEHELKAFWEFLDGSKWNVEWLGMKGKIIKENVVDFGAEYQSVACLITSKLQ